MKHFFSQSFFSLVFAWMLMASAGLPDLAYAVSCSDVVDQATGTRYSDALGAFFYYGDKTYAVALPENSFFQMNANITREYLLDGVDSNSLKRQIFAGKFGAARPLTVSSATVRDFIVDKYGAALSGSGYTYINAWREAGSTSFTAIDGTELPFVDWVTTPDPSASTPSAVTMNLSGKMTPATTGVAGAQIVEFDEKLDCAFDMNPQLPQDPGDGGGGTGTGLVGEGDPNAVEGLICSQDLNNNGFVGEIGELGACLATPQGNLCTVGALDCNTAYQPPQCPAGSVMNYDRDMCQADHISVQCPTGYTWDATFDRCVAPPIACPDGGVFDAVLDLCTKLATDVCPTGYTNAGNGLCTKAVVCLDGGVYNPVNDWCEVSKGLDGCAAGLTYNAALNRCEGSPTCPVDAVYSATYDKCMKPVTVCDAGWTYDATAGQCSFPAACAGGTLDTTLDLCIQTSVGCPTGFTFNASTGKCEASAACNSGGTLDTTYDKCLQPVATCPSGYSWVAAANRCEKDPECVAGTTYNATTNRCEASACPDGTTYSSVDGQCVGDATPETVATTLPATPYWAYCAPEGGFCYVNATTTVSYGRDGCNYYYRTVTYAPPDSVGIACNNATWGDACGGQVKQCNVYVTWGTNPSTATTMVCQTGSDNGVWTECAAESGTCTVSGTQVVRYGSSTQNYYKTVTGSIACTNAAFGGDPYPGVPKTCSVGTPKCYADVLTPPADTTLDGGASVYYANPTCTDGTLDGTADKCYIVPSTQCTSPWTYDSASGQCALPPDCPTSGVYSTALDICQHNGCLSYSCPDGFTWSQPSIRCEKAPACDAGMTYSNTYDKCLQPVQACANGYSWDATRQRCEKAPPECVAGTTYNLTTNKCEATPTCASGTYNATTNTCTSSYAATLSGAVTFNTPAYINGASGDLLFADAGSGIYGYISSVSFAGGLPAYINSAGSLLLPIDNGEGVYGYVSSASFAGGLAAYISGVSGALSSFNSGASIYGYLAPTPGTYGGTYTCPSGGTLSGSTCTITSAAFCPAGASLDGATDKCVANPTCTGGTVDTTNDVCYYAATACDTAAGLTYDAAAGQCAKSAICSDGSVLDAAADLCIVAGACIEIGGDSACPVGYTEDVATGLCYSAKVCAPGSYVSANGRCEAVVTRDCATYTYDAVIGKCAKAPSCPTDAGYSLNNTIAYSPEFDQCMSQAIHTCPSNTSWNTVPINKCEAAPICDGAVYYDPVHDQCLISADCPYGPAYTCMQNPTTGTSQCSPNPCVQVDGDGAVTDTGDPLDETYYDDDGDRDAAGNCLGTVYIFSGKPSRCRPPGWTVGMINDCCAGGDALPENTGSSLGVMSSMYDLYKIAKAMYYAREGFNAAQNGTTFALNEVGGEAAQEAFQIGYQTAETGGSMASGMGQAAANAGKGLAAAAIVWAVGSIISALGGDQDAQMVGAVGATALLSMVEILGTTLLSGPQAIVGIIVIVVMRVLMGSGCEPGDIITAGQVASKRCHFVGEYCEKSWALVGCVQKAKGYCCFNSMLARIINEQGRPQLSVFGPSGGWGEPNRPECRGFTPDEFQAIDFNRVDLSEYLDVVQKDLDAKIQASSQNITDSIQRRFQDIQGLPTD